MNGMVLARLARETFTLFLLQHGVLEPMQAVIALFYRAEYPMSRFLLRTVKVTFGYGFEAAGGLLLTLRSLLSAGQS